MRIYTYRARLSVAASGLALAAAMGVATPAFAQDATTDQLPAGATTVPADQTPPAGTPGDTAAQTAADNTIIVTGYRASLRNATARKKKTETVVESVSAEDIGKLPDNGIGESIARLPGISSQRNNGRANIISIRGFGPDFSTTTLNGREQTTTNDSRAVEFDQYPSEILAGVDVYKTAEADHTAGGLVGSIDLRTIRPLDVSQRIIAIGARGTYVDQKLNPGSSDKGFRLYGTYVNRFAHDNMGIALSAAYADEPYQTKDWNAWGYDSYGPGAKGMSGTKTWFESDKLRRFGANATFQARVDDNFVMTFDGFYSKFTDKIDQRGFEMPFLYGAGNAVVQNYTVTDGLVTAATISGKPVIENYANDRHATQYSIGWNGRWDNHVGTRALFDVSWSRTDRTDDRLETTAGLGHNLPGQTATVSYVMTNHGPEFTSNYDGASSALVLTDVEGWSGATNQAGYDKIRKSIDDLKEFRGEIEHDIGGFLKSVKVGVDHTYRSKVLTQDEAFLVPPNGADFAAIPANLVIGTTNLDRGLGPIIAYDPRVLVGAGVLDYLPNPYGQNAGYNVSESVWTPYAMASLDGQLGAAVLTGNIGVQGVHTDVVSRSNNFPTVRDHYWMWLPSLNLNFRFPNDFVIRFAASKEFMRPRLTDLNNVINVGVDTSRSPIIYSGSGGNPRLRPYEAKALDLNFEKYFGSKGYVALQGFYKHIDTYIANGYDANFDFAGLSLPVAPIPPSTIGTLYSNVNTHGGHMYGVEVAGTLPFDIFSRSLGGFGLTGGAGYTKTKVKDFNGNYTEIPGYSKWVASLTAFYEANGFNARAGMRYRSGFLGDFALFSGGLDRQHVLGETVYDAQIGYDFQPTSSLAGLSVYLQGQNLTNERSATLGDPSLALSYLKYQTYGRRFVLGATYKFHQRELPVAAPVMLPPPPAPAPATQTCADGSVINATATCPVPPPPPAPAPVSSGERGN